MNPMSTMAENVYNQQSYSAPVAHQAQCLNKAMTFISTAFAPRYPPTNNQLSTSSNLMNQSTIQDGRVTVQNMPGRQTQSYRGNSIKGNATGTWVIRYTRNITANQSKVIRCYNCKGEGHFAR
ncbi:nuclear fusion defective 4-like protein [Tanacetum coccineum]